MLVHTLQKMSGIADFAIGVYLCKVFFFSFFSDDITSPNFRKVYFHSFYVTYASGLRT